MATFAFAVNPSLNAKMPFDTFQGFRSGRAGRAFLQHPGRQPRTPIKSIRDLIDYAKSNPGKIDYGSFGNGTSAHLAGALFNSLAGRRSHACTLQGCRTCDHRPDRRSDRGHVHDRRQRRPPSRRAASVRPLAVTSAERSAAFPDLPTVAESGRARLRRGRLVCALRAGRHADRRHRPAQHMRSPSAVQTPAFKKLEKIEGLIIASVRRRISTATSALKQRAGKT